MTSAQVCAAPGCPNLALGRHVQRGYCKEHGAAAVVDVVEEVAGMLDQVVSALDRIASSLDAIVAHRLEDS